MTLEIDVNGGRRAVTLEKSSGAHEFKVTIDGRHYLADAVRTGPSAYSLILLGEQRTSHAVRVVEGVGGDLDVLVRGTVFKTQLNGNRTGRTSADSGSTQEGVQRVKAPMPGKVVRVLVAVGDDVKARQGLVIVEAMKMENELRSPKAGRVKAIAATDGMPVEAGRVLVIVE